MGLLGRKREPILTLHCHHQNDSALRWATMSLHFAVSLITDDSHWTVSINWKSDERHIDE